MRISIVLLVVLSLFGFIPPATNSIVVIVNNDNSVTTLNLSEVRMYWMRRPKKRWDEIDKLVRPVDRRTSCGEKDKFYKDVIKMSEDQVEAYFSARQYQTGENPPAKFSSDGEIIDFVSNEPGAIGYVNEASLRSDRMDKVKIVLRVP